ncbi:CYTOSOL-AP domain-containing protein [Aphelenchoides fujianensis]|nr:CYTOSOL-AP domain-containing protein [Aphelenchoides fujianensis]
MSARFVRLLIVRPNAVRFTTGGMATFRVFAGFNREFGLPNAQVVLIGQHKNVANLAFDDLLAEKLKGVGKENFEAALKRLQPGGSSVPLFLDLAKVLTVSDEVGRNNAPSNAIALQKKLAGLEAVADVKNLSLVLYAQFEHVLASVSAVARAFPLYSRKTKKAGFESVHLEVVVSDGKKLAAKDVQFLQSLVDSIRKCQEQVDKPCNELHSEAFAEEAEQLVDSLNAGGEELLKRGFGGIYHVGKAARHPPVFACFSYTPANASESYALVGKGIVYDTGGMQIKGKTAMPTMKVDMGGAAALLGAFCTLVKSGFQQDLHCLLCIAENAVVRVRQIPLVHPRQQRTEIEQEAIKAGKKSGDLVHPLPYAPELHFASNLKSAVADMKNTNLSGRAVAGLFIGAHVDFPQDVAWLHVDMAGCVLASDRATGYGVALVCQLLSKHLDVDLTK